MRKLDELKHAVADKCVFGWRDVKRLIERVEELERREANALLIPPENRIAKLEGQLQAARELADKLLAPSVVCHQGGVEYEIAYPPHEAVRVIKTQAREFLKMLEE